MKPLQPMQPLTQEILTNFRKKQHFRCSIGKSKWVQYETFNPKYNLREIMNDEVVIEFDEPKDWDMSIDNFRLLVSYPAIVSTAYNLIKDNINFEIWCHGGRSPHLQIQNLPITHLNKDQRKLFKQTFIKYYVPEHYQKFSDYSLCGIHLLAIEWCPHWKGCYGIKKLVYDSEASK